MSHLEETVLRVRKWFESGEKQYPTKVDIFFTEKCNLKCRFCNYSKIPFAQAEQEMNDKTILKLINEICEMDVKIFGILGGEPFLRKSVLLESMRRVKAHDINGSIVTNGTLIEKKDVEKIVEMEWDLIRFSVDGIGETHDHLRGVTGTFDKVMNAIKIFHNVKKNLKSNSPTLETNFVLTNKNYNELGKLIKDMSHYGISFVYILPVIELTEESKHLKVNKTEAAQINESLKEAKKIGEEYGIRSNINEVIKKNLFLYSNKMDEIILEGNKKLAPCFLPWYTMNINSDGSVTPCAQWPKSEGINLNNKSLREIWFKDFEKMRKSIKKQLPECCSRCCVPLVDENIDIRKQLVGA